MAVPRRQNAHIHTLPSPYGPAKWLPPPAPQLPLPGSATKLQNSLISFAVASTPPLPPLHPIPQPKLNARFHSLVYAKSLLPLPMLSTIPFLLYPHPVPPRIRALPVPHTPFLFSQSLLFHFRLGHLPWRLRTVKHSLRNLRSQDPPFRHCPHSTTRLLLNVPQLHLQTRGLHDRSRAPPLQIHRVLLASRVHRRQRPPLLWGAVHSRIPSHHGPMRGRQLHFSGHMPRMMRSGDISRPEHPPQQTRSDKVITAASRKHFILHRISHPHDPHHSFNLIPEPRKFLYSTLSRRQVTSIQCPQVCCVHIRWAIHFVQAYIR
jgi:hypothetical protein